MIKSCFLASLFLFFISIVFILSSVEGFAQAPPVKELEEMIETAKNNIDLNIKALKDVYGRGIELELLHSVKDSVNPRVKDLGDVYTKHSSLELLLSAIHFLEEERAILLEFEKVLSEGIANDEDLICLIDGQEGFIWHLEFKNRGAHSTLSYILRNKLVGGGDAKILRAVIKKLGVNTEDIRKYLEKLKKEEELEQQAVEEIRKKDMSRLEVMDKGLLYRLQKSRDMGVIETINEAEELRRAEIQNITNSMRGIPQEEAIRKEARTRIRARGDGASSPYGGISEEMTREEVRKIIEEREGVSNSWVSWFNRFF